SVAPRREEQVRGLEVAMDDAEGVRVGDRLARFEHAADGLLHTELSGALEPARQVDAAQVLEDDEWRAARKPADIEPARRVRALEARRGLRLAQEPRFFGAAARVAEHLQGNARPEVQVARREDDPHPPFADDALDAVLARNYGSFREVWRPRGRRL